MSRNATKDLTTGSPMKLILGFGIPLLFGMLFQQFYNMMDTIIVGKFLGVSALASVGATGSINFMIIGFCMGVCNGLLFLWPSVLVPRMSMVCENSWLTVSGCRLYLQWLWLYWSVFSAARSLN